MRRLRTLAVAGALVALATGCSGASDRSPDGSSGSSGPTSSSGSSPTTSSSVSSPVLYDGDVAKIPLSGSTQSPLHWQQPAGLTGDAAAVTLTEHRLNSLFLILRSGPNSSTGRRIDPLLSLFFADGAEDYWVQQLGDAAGTRTVAGAQWTKVVGVQVSGSRAVLSSCTVSKADGATGDVEAGRVYTRSTGAGAVAWQQGAVISKKANAACAAWAKSVAR